MNKSNFKYEYLFVLGNGASIASADPELRQILRCVPTIGNFVPLMKEIKEISERNEEPNLFELSALMDENHLEFLTNDYIQRVIEISEKKDETNIVKLLASLEGDIANVSKKIAVMHQNWSNNSRLQEKANGIAPINNEINTLINAIYHTVAAYYTNYNDEYFTRLWQIVQKTKSPVVSLNWDINFEKVIYKDTKKIPMKNYYGKCAFGCLHPDEQSDGFDPVIDILKPHGSLNWYLPDPSGNEHYLTISNDFERTASANYVVPYLCFLIPPVPEKNISDFYSGFFWEIKARIKEDIFSRIRECVASTRTLVIIGYSFPKEDKHIKELFKNNCFKKVLVFDIDKDKKVFRRIKRYFPDAKFEYFKGGFVDIMNWPLGM